jgi:PHS family inorganic phosphate transporter-like MFS transporter
LVRLPALKQDILLISDAGPNATTFIVPGECYPTRIRATAHGVSAAAGKIGAVLAQVVFAPMVRKGATLKDPHPWLDKVMQIFALFMFCGTLTSFLIPETKRKTLEVLAGETRNSVMYEMQSVFRGEDSSRSVERNGEMRKSRGWVGWSRDSFR